MEDSPLFKNLAADFQLQCIKRVKSQRRTNEVIIIMGVGF